MANKDMSEEAREPMTPSDTSGVYELRIDVGVTARGAASPLQIAATVHVPTGYSSMTRATAIFAVPGGGYSRGHYDMHFPQHAGYSQARYHRDNGLIFVACDPIGVGASSLPEAASIDFAMLGDTYDAAVRELCRRIANGTLAPGLPATASLTRIGIGQSMGGKVTVLAQGRRRTFDAIGVLGASAIRTILPQRDAAAREASVQGHMHARGSAVDAESVARSSRSIADFVYPFHWEDVPPDILQADIGGGYPLRRAPVPPFGSATIPPCAVTMMSPGAIAAEAAAVSVPVFVGVGERDVCPDPRAEPRAYANSADITVHIVPRMAHMHNFAGTRELLWARLERWTRGIAGSSDES
jgi:hypothetical protein